MNKALMEQLELEKRKREILKEAQNNKKNYMPQKDTTGNVNSYKAESQYVYDDFLAQESAQESSQKFAWEYELERYRKDKLKDRFYLIGMICGILALILTLYFNASEWLLWF